MNVLDHTRASQRRRQNQSTFSLLATSTVWGSSAFWKWHRSPLSNTSSSVVSIVHSRKILSKRLIALKVKGSLEEALEMCHALEMVESRFVTIVRAQYLGIINARGGPRQSASVVPYPANTTISGVVGDGRVGQCQSASVIPYPATIVSGIIGDGRVGQRQSASVVSYPVAIISGVVGHGRVGQHQSASVVVYPASIIISGVAGDGRVGQRESASVAVVYPATLISVVVGDGRVGQRQIASVIVYPATITSGVASCDGKALQVHIRACAHR